MNILIMDDDEYIVDSIKTMVDWESLGIDEFFSATDVVQAKRIFETVPLQIMLCDIEMRNESGLDFVEWSREQGSMAQVIFLTSYAEFSYAQKAIQLRSSEYLLKPISYPKLEETLIRAVRLAKENDRSLEERRKWENSYAFRREGFWKQVVSGDAGQKQKEIQENIRLLGMPYREENLFVVLFIEIFDFQTILEKLERGMYDFIIKNITNELLGTKGFSAEAVFRTDADDASRWNVVLWMNGEMSPEQCRDRLEQISKDYIWRIRENLNSIVGCYAGSPVPFWKIPEQAEKMAEMVHDDVLGANHVRFLEDYKAREVPYVTPEFSRWEEYLMNREALRLQESVDQYLSHMERVGEVNARNLERFQTEFNQMIFSVLKARNISVDLLWDQINLDANREAAKSVRNMKKYAAGVVQRTIEHMELVEKSQSVVNIVKDYIRSHYAEELTREDLAKQVYLSPDYLSRLFRAEEGENLSNYLIRYRIEKARELLRGTREPIHQIACSVGYTNFSYFAKIFRKYVGCTPNEYRKNKEPEQHPVL